MDDGSTDETRDVSHFFASKDDRFRYVYQVNRGLSAARNTGLQKISGSWVQFLDADDLLHREKIEIQIALVCDENEISFTEFTYFVDRRNIDEYLCAQLANRRIRKEIISPSDTVTGMMKKNITVVNAPIISSALIKRIGLFDESMKALEDWDYWFRASLCGAIFSQIRTGVPLALVRNHKKSLSKNRLTMLRAHNYLVAKIEKQIDRNDYEWKNEYVNHRETLMKSRTYFAGNIIFEEIQKGQMFVGIGWAFAKMFYSLASFRYFLVNMVYSIKVRLIR